MKTNMLNLTLIGGVLILMSSLAACDYYKYECIERSQKDVPNFAADGTHVEVDYVLLHEGHKIYAICDLFSSAEPGARCGFRPLRKYDCTLQPDGVDHATFPLSDLKCKDADGHNVYLYVTKKE